MRPTAAVTSQFVQLHDEEDSAVVQTHPGGHPAAPQAVAYTDLPADDLPIPTPQSSLLDRPDLQRPFAVRHGRRAGGGQLRHHEANWMFFNPASYELVKPSGILRETPTADLELRVLQQRAAAAAAAAQPPAGAAPVTAAAVPQLPLSATPTRNRFMERHFGGGHGGGLQGFKEPHQQQHGSTEARPGPSPRLHLKAKRVEVTDMLKQSSTAVAIPRQQQQQITVPTKPQSSATMTMLQQQYPPPHPTAVSGMDSGDILKSFYVEEENMLVRQLNPSGVHAVMMSGIAEAMELALSGGCVPQVGTVVSPALLRRGSKVIGGGGVPPAPPGVDPTARFAAGKAGRRVVALPPSLTHRVDPAAHIATATGDPSSLSVAEVAANSEPTFIQQQLTATVATDPTQPLLPFPSLQGLQERFTPGVDSRKGGRPPTFEATKCSDVSAPSSPATNGRESRRSLTEQELQELGAALQIDFGGDLRDHLGPTQYDMYAMLTMNAIRSVLRQVPFTKGECLSEEEDINVRVNLQRQYSLLHPHASMCIAESVPNELFGTVTKTEAGVTVELEHEGHVTGARGQFVPVRQLIGVKTRYAASSNIQSCSRNIVERQQLLTELRAQQRKAEEFFGIFSTYTKIPPPLVDDVDVDPDIRFDPSVLFSTQLSLIRPAVLTTMQTECAL